MPRNVVPQPEDILAGNRRALARAITLVESTRPDHRASAEELLARVLDKTGGAVRLGITGIPGVGKSTFIEAFGNHVIAAGKKIAVLAVDPSSPRTGGSILGDKTRMETLARAPDAFIRPSPSGGTLGGVARRTRETMLLCEAAGFDVIVIETVGVGQSETAVADLVDMFLLLLAPGGGDELQGIKKGIVELADLVIVNKADGDLAPAAERARQEYASALHLLRPTYPDWMVPVLKTSARDHDGIQAVWDNILAFREALAPSGALETRRAEQAMAWMWNEITEGLVSRLKADDGVAAALIETEAAVRHHQLTPGDGAKRVLETFLASATQAAEPSRKWG